MIDAFQVGVRMTFASNGPEMLAILLRDLGRVHESVDKLTAKFTALAGAAGAIGGGVILKGLWDTVRANEEWNRQLENTKALGGDIAAHFDAFKKRAEEVSTTVPTSTIAGNQKLLNELATQIGADNALSALPEAAKMQWLLQRDTGEGGKGGDIIDAIKTLDVRGQIFSKDANGNEVVDIQKFNAELDALYHGYAVTRGLVSMKYFLHMMQQSGLAGKAMDREAAYVVNAELATAMGAPKVGTAESSLASQMVGGVMPRRVAEEMTRLHLMNEGEWHSDHGSIVMNPEVSKRMQLAMTNPEKFVNDVIVPAIQAQGGTAVDMFTAMQRIFGRQTTQRLAGELANNDPQMQRARTLAMSAKGINDASAEFGQNDIATNIQKLSAAWQSFMQEIGSDITPTAIKILNAMTDGLHKLTKPRHIPTWRRG